MKLNIDILLIFAGCLLFWVLMLRFFLWEILK